MFFLNNRTILENKNIQPGVRIAWSSQTYEQKNDVMYKFSSIIEIKWKMAAHSVYNTFSWTWKFDSIQKLVPFRHRWSEKSTYEQKIQFQY